MHKNAQHRAILLAALYDAREAKPKQGWLFEHELRGLVEDPSFALEVLIEQGYVQNGGTKHRITAKGVLAHEAAEQTD